MERQSTVVDFMLTVYTSIYLLTGGTVGIVSKETGAALVVSRVLAPRESE